MSLNPLRVSLDNIIPLTEARDHFSQIVNEVQKDKLYVLTKGGKPAVAIVDVKYLEHITGGNVNSNHVEQEIQKNPAKVGRPEMLKHDSPVASAPLATPPLPPKPSTPTPPQAPKPVTNPVPFPPKQPQQNNNPTPPTRPNVPAEWNKPATTPPLNPPAPPVQNKPVPPVFPSTPPTPPTPKPATPTPTPAQAPQSTIESSFNNQLDKKPAFETPKPSSTIDVHPMADIDDAAQQNASQSDNSRVSPDDKPNPAQYTGNTGSPMHEEPDDMNID